MPNNKPITTSELAKILNTQNNVILNTAKKYIPNKDIKNGVATFFNEEETSIIIKNLDYDNSQAKEPFTAVKGTIKTALMLQNEIDNSLKLPLTLSKQIEKAKSLPKEEKLTLALATFQSLLEDLEQDKKNLQQSINDLKIKSQELQEKENERLYLENEKYKSKELRIKINKAIKKLGDPYRNYKAIWNKYYDLYSNIHCFKGQQNLDLVQDRGHLKEFYNLILNN